MTNNDYWHKLVKFLKINYKTARPVYIRRVKNLKDSGYTYFDEAKITIKVKTSQSWDGQVDTLLHEYAHAYAIDQACQHAGSWGDIFGKIYQSWENWNNIV